MRPFRTAVFLALPLLAATMLTAPAHADVKDGVDAWQRGDYQGAVAQWRPAALAGDADAQFNLGQAYKLGRGVPTDLTQAEAWYRRAAKQGHLQAEDNLGLVLFTANRRDEAMPFIIRSAERGEPRAQYVLGTAHFNGDLAPHDLARAYALTKRASDAGLAIASARLAQLDSLIPLDQRQRGLAMLPEIEKNEARARLSAVTAAAPPAAKPAATPIKTASLPASVPGASYAPPPVIATPAPSTPAAKAATIAAVEATAAADAAKGKPGTTYAPPPASGTLPPAPPKSKPPVNNAPITVRETPTPARPTGGNSPWRAQLGAFGVEANARNLWTSLGKKHPAVAERQPIYLKTGKVTRLQTGGFANRGEANNFCAALSKSGQACLVVDK
ncbi:MULTISPECIES: SPOR domain-containing protein [unclassified Sphingopyxis]|jgi:cell division septation protein DedD|uniref:SPOR domain-containing protein n=1 Tax=unclassified Sphingopyxis TaxID=2614943 RepID=UPI0025DE62C6|nr:MULTISPECIES: SPOR domain-containing protein [unclassified Sphingopyxis]